MKLSVFSENLKIRTKKMFKKYTISIEYKAGKFAEIYYIISVVKY